jgi:hypothetical protein
VSGASWRRTFLLYRLAAKDIFVWKFFLGACLLTAAVLQPHAPAKSIVVGMGLAGLVLCAWALASRARSREAGVDKPNQRRNGRNTDA